MPLTHVIIYAACPLAALANAFTLTTTQRRQWSLPMPIISIEVTPDSPIFEPNASPPQQYRQWSHHQRKHVSTVTDQQRQALSSFHKLKDRAGNGQSEHSRCQNHPSIEKGSQIESRQFGSPIVQHRSIGCRWIFASSVGRSPTLARLLPLGVLVGS